VNEEGTEAAAATGVIMLSSSLYEAPAVFHADHPFFFIIRDNKSGSVLFMGRSWTRQAQVKMTGTLRRIGGDED